MITFHLCALCESPDPSIFQEESATPDYPFNGYCDMILCKEKFLQGLTNCDHLLMCCNCLCMGGSRKGG